MRMRKRFNVHIFYLYVRIQRMGGTCYNLYLYRFCKPKKKKNPKQLQYAFCARAQLKKNAQFYFCIYLTFLFFILFIYYFLT